MSIGLEKSTSTVFGFVAAASLTVGYPTSCEGMSTSGRLILIAPGSDVFHVLSVAVTQTWYGHASGVDSSKTTTSGKTYHRPSVPNCTLGNMHIIRSEFVAQGLAVSHSASYS